MAIRYDIRVHKDKDALTRQDNMLRNYTISIWHMTKYRTTLKAKIHTYSHIHQSADYKEVGSPAKKFVQMPWSDP